MGKPGERQYGYDNLRFLLILLVVLGHLLEICPAFPGSRSLYRVIYVFHMPAFLLLFGYFAVFRWKRIIKGFLLPYLLFQTGYILFSNGVLGTALPMQYTRPYWILWYLLVCIFYQLLLPVCRTEKGWLQGLLLGASVCLSLWAGYRENIGYDWSLSRFLVFLPWFLLGVYFRMRETQARKAYARVRWVWPGACLAVAVWSILYLHNAGFPNAALYGSYPYARLGYSAGVRLIFMVCALGWIGLLLPLFLGTLNRKLPLITAIGQNTLPVFLLHGFAVKAIARYGKSLWNIPGAVLWLTLSILLVFGNPLMGKAFRWLFSSRRNVKC